MSADLGMPFVPIQERNALEQFTNRFNPERIVPQLTLFSTRGSLLRENALDGMEQMRGTDEINHSWRNWLNESESETAQQQSRGKNTN